MKNLFILISIFTSMSVSAATPITKENYVIAETDWYFSGVQKKAGVNTWMHDDPVSKDNQQVIRSNRDVVYSIAIVDVSEGATFTVPKSDEFQLIQIIDEAHLFHQVVLNGESLHVSAEDIVGEYVYLLGRTRDNGDLTDTKARQAKLNFEAKANRPYPAKGFAEKDVATQQVEHKVDEKHNIILSIPSIFETMCVARAPKRPNWTIIFFLENAAM